LASGLSTTTAVVYPTAATIYLVDVSATEATLEIKNRLGLHLRAASTLFQTVKTFKSSVSIANGQQEVNARSVTGLMMLGAGQGTKLKVKVAGPDAAAAMAAIKALFDARFGEE
jgi:phosphocarrier protein HPr